MNVLMYNHRDSGGGAVQATIRLHNGLLETSVNSTLLVSDKTTSDPTIKGPNSRIARANAKFRNLVDMVPMIRYNNQQGKSFSSSWFPDRLSSKIQNIDHEILHLNKVAGFVQIETIGEFQKPIIWTLHDMWPFTGGCHFSYGCASFESECGGCPILQSEEENDLSKRVWRRKRRAWQNIDPIIVTPSTWLAHRARKSSLFGQYRIEHIPYGVDSEWYGNVDQVQARNSLNINEDTRVLLFGANSVTLRKGHEYLRKSLSTLIEEYDTSDVELIVFGKYGEDIFEEIDLPAKSLGYLDQQRLRLAYAAADILLTPSIQDNLPNVVLEAMATGTPCVSFDIGGMPDMILHEKTGYLAEPLNTRDFANGINHLLSRDLERASLDSKERVEKEFDIQHTVKQYVSLYEDVIN